MKHISNKYPIIHAIISNIWKVWNTFIPLTVTDTLLSSGQVLINKLQVAAYGLNFFDIPKNKQIKSQTDSELNQYFKKLRLNNYIISN